VNHNFIIRKVEKYFGSITNSIFGLSILILVGQMVELALDFDNLMVFYKFFKPFNTLFAFLCIAFSYILLKSSNNIYEKISRSIYLILSTLFFISSVIWQFSLFKYDFDATLISHALAILLGMVSISFKIANLGDSNLHPALLFVISFIVLILLGAFALIHPAATVKGISFTHALFTATSAVTVTGLAVLDTGKDFTTFGQTVILILIQLGGLGVLTVSNIFALVFKSNSSFKNRMIIGDMIKEMDNDRIFSTLFKIVFITIVVEAIGAILIYMLVPMNEGLGGDRAFFAIFHAVSAFCNGGFSTMTNSLYEEPVRFNYGFHLIVAWLIFTGGIGYSVMINHYKHIKTYLLKKVHLLRYKKYQPNTINLIKTTTNNKIIIITSGILLLSGTLLFYIAEYNGVLAGHSGFGKIFTALFNAVTPRTAGFNNVNMADLALPSTVLIMFLMWIGASPGSTGGGIKTTTFAIVTLNLINQITGKDKMVVNNREIPPVTINQVNAVIILSIIAIMTTTFLLSWFNPALPLKDIMFEAISAYSTVGLSIGITGSLSSESLYVLMVTMFLGRVIFLTFLSGIFNQLSKKRDASTAYYPPESIYIN